MRQLEMAKRSYDQKFNNIRDWVEITNHHWHRLKGEMFNDQEFWEHTLHAMSDQDWWDWVDIEPSIKIQYEEHFRKYSKLTEDTKEIYTKLALGKPITRKMGISKNLTAFRALMCIKDLFNDINGTPTVPYDKPKVTANDDQTQFEILFEFK
jgi:hypothetical protein